MSNTNQAEQVKARVESLIKDTVLAGCTEAVLDQTINTALDMGVLKGVYLSTKVIDLKDGSVLRLSAPSVPHNPTKLIAQDKRA